MSILHKFLRQIFKGVSWKNKYFSFLIKMIDIPDHLVCQAKGLSYLPVYSLRVRSDGTTKQFGGSKFLKGGQDTAQYLLDYAMLKAENQVLEIGCGTGRTAFELTKILKPGNYRGIDIDKISVDACNKNQLFQQSKFKFEHLNVYNPVYNEKGKFTADNYSFTYADQTYDVIFLISVFTHMLPEGITNYLQEISRLLRPGGRCLLTTFLMDYGKEGEILNFPYEHGFYCVHQEDLPEKAVGYYLKFFEDTCKNLNLSLETKRLGNWRSSKVSEPSIEFGQDLLVFKKEE